MSIQFQHCVKVRLKVTIKKYMWSGFWVFLFCWFFLLFFFFTKVQESPTSTKEWFLFPLFKWVSLLNDRISTDFSAASGPSSRSHKLNPCNKSMTIVSTVNASKSLRVPEKFVNKNVKSWRKKNKKQLKVLFFQ